MQAINVRVIDTDFYQVSIKKAIITSPTYMKVKMSSDRLSDEKVYGLDFQNALPDISYNASREEALGAVIGAVSHKGETLHTVHGWDCGYTKQVTQFPHYFCLADGETETDMDVDVEYYAPALETAAEFYERLMPFLHNAAKSYLDQHIPTAELTGNPRGVHTTTRHTASKTRADTTANAFRLPIGFAVRELDSHRQGNNIGLTRDELEMLIIDIHKVFTKGDVWWEHHYGHDVRYWNKYHNARQILFQNSDGTIESIYDIDANIRKNLPKIDRDNTDLIAKHGEVEFDSLARDWFNKALYGSREHVTERMLTFGEKT